MGLNRIVAIAHNTFRESVRDKVLYVLLFFAAVSILGSKAIGWISIGQDIKIMRDFTLASLLIFGVLISIFVGASLVYKELDKRTLYTILARPVRRSEFILGKYLGLASLLGVVTLGMAAVSVLYILLLGGSLSASYFAAIFLVYCELLLLTAFAVLMSTVTTPVLGALVVVAFFIFGNATGVLADLPKQVAESAAKPFLTFLYHIVPNLGLFNIRAEAANGVPIAPLYVLWTAGYGAIYSVCFLFLATLAFEEKDV